tara:strand:- start:276 stop:434 length:159 start_codon:yes stop_codon:yes gene_type:complete
MPKKKPDAVIDWPQLNTRIDPESDAAFKAALEKNKESQSKVIRRMIRKYSAK